jgi:amino acid transporter
MRELRHGAAGIVEALGESVAVLALAMGVAFGSSAAAGEAGIAVPAAYWIAGLGSLALASVIVRFSRRTASAGALYAYIREGLGPRAGFVGGWAYAGAFAVGVSFVLVIGAFFLSTALSAHTGWHPGWYPLFFVLGALVVALAALDVRVSTRVALALAGCGFVSVLFMALAIVVQGGDSGLSLAPLNPGRAPSSGGLFLAVTLGFTGFIGFEAAAALGEETRDPLRAIPRAVLTAVLVALGFYVFVTWAMAVGYGVDNAAAWAKDPAALDTLASRYVGDWLAVAIDFSVAATAFVAALGGLNLTARTVYSLARDGSLPRALAYTSPRTGAPWAGIALAAAITLVLGIVEAHRYGPITYFAFIATTATLAILVTYILVALSGLVVFRSGVLDVVAPVVAIAICGYTIYKSISPKPPHPIDLAPYLAGGWLVLGAAFSLRVEHSSTVAV